MGRQAKQKQQRRSATSQPAEPKSTDFKQQLEKQGYQFDQIQRAPELPDDKPQPQI